MHQDFPMVEDEVKRKRTVYRLLMLLVIPVITFLRNPMTINLAMFGTILTGAILEIVFLTVFFHHDDVREITRHYATQSLPAGTHSYLFKPAPETQALEAEFTVVKESTPTTVRTINLNSSLFFAEESGLPSGTDTRRVTIVIAAHNEHEFTLPTLMSITEETPPHILREIIIVDDASDPPMHTTFPAANYPQVRIVRNEDREGLIRSKVIGAEAAAAGDVLVFLDAHVRPDKGWLRALLQGVNTNPKRIVVPLIPVLDEKTWEIDRRAVGYKMLFDWSLEFNWFDDHTDVVPVMSGGLYAIDRDWFVQSGSYDMAMLQWGGENIEQSLRIWMCGGEIFVARDSMVGHVFRAKSPYVVEVEQIKKNQVRAIQVWFNERSIKRYTDVKPSVLKYPPFDLEARLDIKRGKTGLKCKSDFEKDYMRRFRNAFVIKGNIHSPAVTIGAPPPITGTPPEGKLCLTAHPSSIRAKGGKLEVVPCGSADTNLGMGSQTLPFVWVNGGRSLAVVHVPIELRYMLCLYDNSTSDGKQHAATLAACELPEVKPVSHSVQTWFAYAVSDPTLDRPMDSPLVDRDPIGIKIVSGSNCLTHTKYGTLAWLRCTANHAAHQIFTHEGHWDFRTYMEKDLNLRKKKDRKAPTMPFARPYVDYLHEYVKEKGRREALRVSTEDPREALELSKMTPEPQDDYDYL